MKRTQSRSHRCHAINASAAIAVARVATSEAGDGFDSATLARHESGVAIPGGEALRRPPSPRAQQVGVFAAALQRARMEGNNQSGLTSDMAAAGALR